MEEPRQEPPVSEAQKNQQLENKVGAEINLISQLEWVKLAQALGKSPNVLIQEMKVSVRDAARQAADAALLGNLPEAELIKAIGAAAHEAATAWLKAQQAAAEKAKIDQLLISLANPVPAYALAIGILRANNEGMPANPVILAAAESVIATARENVKNNWGAPINLFIDAIAKMTGHGDNFTIPLHERIITALAEHGAGSSAGMDKSQMVNAMSGIAEKALLETPLPGGLQVGEVSSLAQILNAAKNAAMTGVPLRGKEDESAPPVMSYNDALDIIRQENEQGPTDPAASTQARLVMADTQRQMLATYGDQITKFTGTLRLDPVTTQNLSTAMVDGLARLNPDELANGDILSILANIAEPTLNRQPFADTEDTRELLASAEDAARGLGDSKKPEEGGAPDEAPKGLQEAIALATQTGTGLLTAARSYTAPTALDKVGAFMGRIFGGAEADSSTQGNKLPQLLAQADASVGVLNSMGVPEASNAAEALSAAIILARETLEKGKPVNEADANAALTRIASIGQEGQPNARIA